MRRGDREVIALAMLLALGGCREERGPAITPIDVSGSQRAVIAEEPAPVFVSPHVRRTEGGDRSARTPLRAGGGGGGRASDLEPRPAPAPTSREVDRFRTELDREIAEIDATDDPCDQLGDVMRASLEATNQPSAGDARVPSRDELRQSCRQWPAAYRQCMSPEYFREHVDECQQEITRMARRGERASASARSQLDAIEAGREPWPGQRPAVAPPRTDQEAEQ